MKKYTFVIPVKNINDHIRDIVPKINAFGRDDFEILIYPDENSDEIWPKTRQIETGPAGPAVKRNSAVKDARGEILIFLDDDSYPEKNYLEILEIDFSDPKIIAVGGPAMTPEDSPFWQKVSGATFLSSLSGGFPERYRPLGKKKLVDDWPTVNLAVRKKIFEEVGGFRLDYWPGEDTIFCLDLLNKKGAKILYDPELIVYHHRRDGVLKHIKQISSYGLHRGYFAKRFPETSLRWRYFMPSAFVLFIILGAVAGLYYPPLAYLYVFGWGVYLVALGNAFFDIMKHEKRFLVALAAPYYIFLTHIFYGLRFLQGLVFTRKLKSKMR